MGNVSKILKKDKTSEECLFDQGILETSEEEEETDQEDTKTKKGKGKGTSSSETTEEETKLEKRCNKRTKRYKSMKKIDDTRIKTFSDEIRFALKDLEADLNDKRNSPSINENGVIPSLLDQMLPMTTLAMNYLGRISTQIDGDYMSTDTINRLKDIISGIKNVHAAVNKAEYSQAIGPLATTLYQLVTTTKMLTGESNLINVPESGNDELEEGNIDLYARNKFFNESYYNNKDKTGEKEDYRFIKRNDVTDNSIEPDFHIYKPVFLLFVNDELKSKLRDLGVSSNLIGDYKDNNDFGILGHYQLPTLFSNTEGSELDQPELLTFENLNDFNVEDNGKPTQSFAPFEWSRNGAYHVNSKTLTKYEAINNKFVEEVRHMYESAQALKIDEMTQDVCFCKVLADWLNGYYFAMIDVTYNYLAEELSNGIMVNEKRMVMPSEDEKALALALNYQLPDVQSNGFTSNLINTLINYINMDYKNQTARKWTYSQVAYDHVCKIMRTQKFTINSSTKYYAGSNEVGDHFSVVSVIPKLYLPVDLADDFTDFAETPILVPTGTQDYDYLPETAAKIINPLSFAFTIEKATHDIMRYQHRAAVLVNFCIPYQIYQMGNKDYGDLVSDFLAKTYVETNESETKSLLDLYYPNHNDNKSMAVAYRDMTNVAPCFNRKKVLLAPITVASDIKTPIHIVDQYLNTKGNALSGFTYGAFDYIQSFANYHVDFSWLLAAIVSTKLFECYVNNPTPLYTDGDDGIEVVTIKPLTIALSPDSNLIAEDITYPIETLLRLNSHIFELKNNTFNVIRRDGDLISTQLNAKVSNDFAGKDDIRNAFRFTSIKEDDNNLFLIDNQLLIDAPYANAFEYFPDVQDGSITGYKLLSSKKDGINITADAIKSHIVNAELRKEGLLMFDTRPTTEDDDMNSHITYEVSVNKRMGLVGYKLPQYADSKGKVNNKIALDMYNKVYYPGTEDNEYRVPIGQFINMNKYLYLTNDVVPTTVLSFNTIPSNNTLSYKVLTNLLGIKLSNKAWDAARSVNKVKFFDVLSSAFKYNGLIYKNQAQAVNLLQSFFGLRKRVIGMPVILDSATKYSDRDINWYASKVGAVSDTDIAALVSSYRYPSTQIVPATDFISGMVPFVDKEEDISIVDAIHNVSMNKYVNLCKALNAKLIMVDPDTNVDVFRYLQFSDMELPYVFEVRHGGNNPHDSAYGDTIVDINSYSLLTELGIIRK